MRDLTGATVTATLIVPSLAACHEKVTGAATQVTAAPISTPQSGTPPVDVTSPPASASEASAAPSGSEAPPARSLLPDGDYRSRIVQALLSRSGPNPDDGDPGTWTLTVKAGTYRLACAPISDPGSDCGNDGVDTLATVEHGTVRGSGPTIWFLDEQDAGGYHMHWALRGHALLFTNYVGFGLFADEDPVNTETVQPWTRIS